MKTIWFEADNVNYDAEVICETAKAYLLVNEDGVAGFSQRERWIPKSAVLSDVIGYEDDTCERHVVILANWWLNQEQIWG